MCNHMVMDAIDLAAGEASTALQYYGIKPELGNTIVSLHMNMSRLIPISRVEEESIRPNDHHCGHLVQVSICRVAVETRNLPRHLDPVVGLFRYTK